MVAYFSLRINDISHVDAGLIKAAAKFAIEQNVEQFILGIRCEEVKSNIDCLDAIWDKLQGLLSFVYEIQLKQAFDSHKPLFNFNTVFEDVCGYSVHLEPQLTDIFYIEEDFGQINQWNKEREEIGLIKLNNHLFKSTSLTQLSFTQTTKRPRIFQRVILGGTFDQFHVGHKILLTMATLLAKDTMVACISDDCMLKGKKHTELIAPTEYRKEVVQAFLYSAKRTNKIEIESLLDPFGPTVTDPTIDLLVVSKETLDGGHLVNKERGLRNFSILELRIIDVVWSGNELYDDQNNIVKFGSSWIRGYIASKG